MTGHGDKVFSLAVAPDGTIASGDGSGEIRLWDSREPGAACEGAGQTEDEGGLLELQPG